MTWRSYVLAATMALALVPEIATAEDPQKADAPLPPEGAAAKPDAAATHAGLASQTEDEEVWFSPVMREINGRFGWWGMDSKGGPTKIGEFQDLDSSPFWDVDGLWTSGDRTIDFSVTGLDNEGTQGHLYFFGPRVSVKAEYDRYLRRLDRKGIEVPGPAPFDGTIFQNFNPDSGASSSQRVLNSDVLNAGRDYAIRVQEFRTDFKGTISENLKWRINVWGMEKDGVRQASKLGHCFDESAITPGQPTGSRCHLFAQPQRIDWMTTEVEPVLEAKLGPLTIEYSRTMRTFDQDDQVVSRRYSNASHTGWPVANTDVPYDVAADNYTQIDRLKLSADVTEYNHFYGLAYAGNTHNQLRDTHRFFNGFDLRLTNDRFDGLKMTAYAKKFKDDGQLPSTFPESPLVQGGDSLADYHQPLNYDKTAAGIKGRWQPSRSGWPAARGLALIGGYEWASIHRQFADYEADDPRWLTGPAPGVADTWEFEQPDTTFHTFNIGPSMRWSACFDSFIRYKHISASDPVYGFRATIGDINTNQPTQQDIVEIGGTWMPADNFMLTATVGIENRRHNSLHDNEGQAFEVLHDNPRQTDFNDYSYPVVVTAWYAPSTRWSFSAGYASFSDRLDQLITLGDLYGDNLLNTSSSSVANPTPPPDLIGARNYFEPDAFQSRWQYIGRAQVVSLGAVYACSDRVKLSGGYEYTRSRNGITAAPSPASAYDPSDTTAPPTVVTPDWTLLPTYSDVIVQTNRITAGIDYLAGERITLFARYNFFDYDDRAGTGNSGTVHGVLGGLSAAF